MYNWVLNTIYSFNTLAPGLLGASFTNVKLVAETNYVIAKTMNLGNLDLLHAELFPYLPSGTPNNPTAYLYLVFQTPNNTLVLLGAPWIDQTSIASTNLGTLVVTIPNAGSNLIAPITASLSLMGITGFSIIMNPL